jgi:hypothetical protein
LAKLLLPIFDILEYSDPINLPNANRLPYFANCQLSWAIATILISVKHFLESGEALPW